MPYPSSSFKIPKTLLLIILVQLTLITTTTQFNTSICGYIEMNQLYYFINEQRTDQNIQSKYIDNQTNLQYKLLFNFCHQLEYYCEKTNSIVKGTLVVVGSNSSGSTQQDQCKVYQQARIQLINQDNATHGINVFYQQKNNNTATNSNTKPIVLSYPCNADNKIGCPSVARTTLWTYFSNNSIGYTIAIEVIGVLFMILGVYMYRVTLVILGWATSFIILLSIQQTVVFIPGVPQQVLTDVMIITIICSFFVGYVLAYFPKAGLFCMGMWIGLIISLTLNNVALYLIFSTPQNLPLYIVLPVLCIGFGILTVCVKRKFIIFATSLIGAYICLRALSWHLGAFPNQLLYPEEYQLGLKGIVTWQFYLYVVALLILTASSSALQFWLFKKKSQKTHGSSDIDEHFDQMQNKLENQRQKLIEFDNIFKKLKPQFKGPRVLKKDYQNQEYDQYELTSKKKSGKSNQDLSFGQEPSQQSQQESPNYPKKNKPNDKINTLKDTLLQKKQNRKKY